MKILIPIDFSTASRQAMRYAHYLAKHREAELILLHVFDIPVMTADAYVFIPPQEEIDAIKENHIIHLQQFVRRDLQLRNRKENIRYQCVYGNPTDQILEYSKQENVDLIIMGIQGKCIRPNFFMGSTFIHIMNNARIPVIGLHGSTKFSDLNHILFTYDLKEFSSRTLLEPVIQLSRFFKAHISVLNVSNEISDFPLLAEQLKKNELNPSILNADVSFHIIQHKDTIEGIKSFLLDHNIDLICFIPREHGLLSKIFKESTTRKAAFQIDLPLMSIHN
jgi:nucleotide-binding universal stress UspA family protein